MAGPRLLESGFSFWGNQPQPLPIAQIIARYEAGFAGAYAEPEERNMFRDWVARNGGNPNGNDAFSASGIAGSSDGKLGLSFLPAALALGANPWPGAAQARGDCTTHGDKNANLVSWGYEAFSGQPDPETGVIEGVPEGLQLAGILDGAFSPEMSWLIRVMESGGGDGWSCAAAARASCEKIGFWPRMNYPELGFDITKYSYENTTRYRKVPDNVLQFGLKHRIRTATELDGWEPICDALSNYYGVNSCGGQAWSSVRDENGYSPTKAGGWSHSEGYTGFDRRPWVAKKYRVPALLLQQNSWAKWNSGPRDVYDSAQYVPPDLKQRMIDAGLVNPQTGNVMIPEGSRWVACTTADSRYAVAKSSVLGWKRRQLPDWGGSLAG